MDDVRGLDTYIFADSLLHYRFEGRADLAQHRHRDRHHAGLQLPDIHHERELNRSARINLFSNASHLTPGQVLEPQGDVITTLKAGVVLTLVTYRGARDSRLHVSVWGLPYTERYCFRPADIPCQEIHGTLRGRVESRVTAICGCGRRNLMPDSGPPLLTVAHNVSKPGKGGRCHKHGKKHRACWSLLKLEMTECIRHPGMRGMSCTATGRKERILAFGRIICICCRS